MSCSTTYIKDEEDEPTLRPEGQRQEGIVHSAKLLRERHVAATPDIDRRRDHIDRVNLYIEQNLHKVCG